MLYITCATQKYLTAEVSVPKHVTQREALTFIPRGPGRPGGPTGPSSPGRPGFPGSPYKFPQLIIDQTT